MPPILAMIRELCRPTISLGVPTDLERRANLRVAESDANVDLSSLRILAQAARQCPRAS